MNTESKRIVKRGDKKEKSSLSSYFRLNTIGKISFDWGGGGY